MQDLSRKATIVSVMLALARSSVTPRGDAMTVADRTRATRSAELARSVSVSSGSSTQTRQACAAPATIVKMAETLARAANGQTSQSPLAEYQIGEVYARS
jgi:hypothetical protein